MIWAVDSRYVPSTCRRFTIYYLHYPVRLATAFAFLLRSVNGNHFQTLNSCVARVIWKSHKDARRAWIGFQSWSRSSHLHVNLR